MTENERIKQVRKAKSLTLEEFGKKVGVKKAAMSNIENGVRGVTEQMRLAICREFGVSENWLRTGEGEMFVNPLSQQLEDIYQRHELTPEDRILVEEFLALGPEVRRGVLEYISRVSAALKQMNEQDKIRREAEEIAWQMREEKERAEDLSALQDTDSEEKMA